VLHDVLLQTKTIKLLQKSDIAQI